MGVFIFKDEMQAELNENKHVAKKPSVKIKKSNEEEVIELAIGESQLVKKMKK